MPTYAYACKDCGHAFDVVQSFSDSSLTSCPECEGTLRKKFNSVGVVFKGSGFYQTDYRSESYRKAASADSSSAESKSDSKSTKSGESTNGAAKSETKPASAKPKKSE